MFRWIKDLWLGSEPVEFVSAYGLTESVTRLKAATKQWSLFNVSEQAAVGRVGGTRVSLRRVIPMIGNSFKPLFTSRFAEQRGQVHLKMMLITLVVSRARPVQCRSLVLMLLLAGCTSRMVEPNLVTVVATPDVLDAGRVEGEVPVMLTVGNGSRGTLHLQIDDESGPPFHINWVHYRVLRGSATGFVEDLDHSPFEDGVVSMAALRVDPGDSTTVRTVMEHVSKSDCSKLFAIELEDNSHTLLRSQPFRLCGLGQ